MERSVRNFIFTGNTGLEGRILAGLSKEMMNGGGRSRPILQEEV